MATLDINRLNAAMDKANPMPLGYASDILQRTGAAMVAAAQAAGDGLTDDQASTAGVTKLPGQSGRDAAQTRLSSIINRVAGESQDPIPTDERAEVRAAIDQAATEINATQDGVDTDTANSLTGAFEQSISELPQTIGNAVGTVAGAAGGAAGSLAGGFLTGLFKSNPIVGIFLCGAALYIGARLLGKVKVRR